MTISMFYSPVSPLYDPENKQENILREKNLAIYFEDSQFRRNRTYNFKVPKIYVDKRARVR